MKLIITIVDDQDADKLTTALTGLRVGVTRLTSTGGLIDPGHSTLLVGLDDGQVQPTLKIIAEIASPRPGLFPYTYNLNLPPTGYIEVNVGGFMAFVLDIDHFEQV